MNIESGENKDQLFSKIKELESVSMIDTIPESETTFMISGKEGLQSRKDIFNLCVKNNWVLTEMTPIETKLEDIFRNLTTN